MPRIQVQLGFIYLFFIPDTVFSMDQFRLGNILHGGLFSSRSACSNLATRPTEQADRGLTAEGSPTDQGGCVSDRPSAPLDFKTTRMTNMKTPFSGNYNLSAYHFL